MPTTCALCRRSIPHERIADPAVVQEHHLIPENRAESPTVDLCRPCHNQIHAVFTNAELRNSYNTIKTLRNAERLSGYIDWIRTTEKLTIDVKTSEHVRRRE
jgi:hypothetical protein